MGFKKNVECTIYESKTKALIGRAVTAKLICAFIFAYVCWFSYNIIAAHISGHSKDKKNRNGCISVTLQKQCPLIGPLKIKHKFP